MGLINLQTNLKSLKFGQDRVHGGSSKQPYIQTPIPENSGGFGTLDTDFILRGGSRAITDSVKDVERLGKYFLDIRNPSGLLFVAKQNLLSRTAVRTQASGILNEGIYTPLSTLAEAGGVAFGLHVNKQGLNPFSGLGSIGSSTPNKYEDAVKKTNKPFTIETSTSTSYTPVANDYMSIYEGGDLFTDVATTVTTTNVPESKNNRLVLLWNDNIKNESKNLVNIRSYPGGPGSTLGIGSTYIRFATGNGSNDVRTGVNNTELKNSTFLPKFENAAPRDYNYTVFKNHAQHVSGINIDGRNLLGVSNEYLGLYPLDPIDDINGITPLGKIDSSLRNVGQLDTIDKNIINGSYVYSQDEIFKIPTKNISTGESTLTGKLGSTSVTGDFRALLRKNPNLGSIISAPNYTTKNIEQRVNLGNPGNRDGKNLLSYTDGEDKGAASMSSYDKINSSEIGADHQNDLVKFRIGVINNDKDLTVTNIHFRAFLNQISDTYNADWQDTRYIGRGEKFYTYTGFDRKVSLSWTVAAQSKKELIPMYKKLNYLASICAPNYSGNGYMQGNIVKLTIGGYFFEQPGIITGLSYEMNDDNATWEIGIDDEGEYDSSVKELPHLIKVSSFNFIPIHTFVPRLVQNKGIGTEERYIALANGIGLESTNYKA